MQGVRTPDTLAQNSTGLTTYLLLENTDGTPATTLAHNTAGLTAYYFRPDTGSTAITLVTQTPTGAWTSGGFCAVDATNAPGLYRLDVPAGVTVHTATHTANQVALCVRGTGLHPTTAVSWLVPAPRLYATVDTSPTRALIRLAGLSVGTNQLLRRQLQVLTGAAAHERVTIVECANTGDVALSPPLSVVPTAGDRVVIW